MSPKTMIKMTGETPGVLHKKEKKSNKKGEREKREERAYRELQCIIAFIIKFMNDFAFLMHS